MRRIKKLFKSVLKQTKDFIVGIWGRKELWADAIFIFLIVTMMTCIPSGYKLIDSDLGRVLLGAGLLIATAAIGLYLVIRIIRRNKSGKFKKEVYLHLMVRVSVISIGMWIYAGLMVNIVHPSMSGIYAIKMSPKEKNIILILNSIFFVLYSQSYITIFTEAEKGAGEFLKRLIKTWLYTIMPIFGMSLMFTLITERIKEMQSPATYIMNIILTTFLWVTSIAINEKMKRGE